MHVHIQVDTDSARSITPWALFVVFILGPCEPLIPILMFTAKTQVEDKLAGYDAGVDIYLTKPAHPVELQANIKALLSQKKARSEARLNRGYTVGVLATKGGVGVSTIALNLAVAAKQKSKANVLAAELRPGQGTWGDELGISTNFGLTNLLHMSRTEITPDSVGKQLSQSSFGVPLLLASDQPCDADCMASLTNFEAVIEDLGQRMEQQARSFGLEIRTQGVSGIATAGGVHRVTTAGGELTCRAVVVTTGARSNRLGVPGEAELTGRGVSYCATCDGAFYQGVPVAVVGGGDTALEEALFLTRYASKVFLVHRRSEFRGTRLLQERIAAEPKIEPVRDAVVETVEGKDGVTGLLLKNVKTGAETALECAGVFVAIGHAPNTQMFKGQLDLDGNGYILRKEGSATSVPVCPSITRVAGGVSCAW